MAMWLAGLRTRRSAELATTWGGVATLLQATRGMVGNIVSVSTANKPIDMAIPWFIGASLPLLFLMVAGVLLWRRQNPIWGTLAVLWVLIDTVVFTPAPASTIAITATVVRIALLVVTMNGVRGALALRKVDYEREITSSPR